MVFQLYWFISYSTLPLIFPILSIGLFIVLSQIDSRIVHKQQVTTKLIQINQTEIDYLQGNLNPFSQGKEFLQTTHPYAADLDLFGEQSLFCHLNRTISTGGTRQLTDWLLHPCTTAAHQTSPTSRSRTIRTSGMVSAIPSTRSSAKQ